jgi:hypothetical protein
MSVDNLWSQMPFYNKSYLISHEFHTLELVRMSNLPGLLPDATPLVTRFLAEISKKRQRCAFVNLYNNNKQQLSQNKW